MIIKRVDNIEEARKCNDLLSLLINDEKKYNENIKDDVVISNWYEKLYDMDDNILFIAKDNDKIIGYIYLKLLSANDNLSIYNETKCDALYVLEDYRKLGVATKLLNEGIKWSKSNNAKYINLNVLSENKNALDLYIKNGFSEISKQLRFEIGNQ